MCPKDRVPLRHGSCSRRSPSSVLRPPGRPLASLCPPEVIIGLDGNEVETFGALSDEPLDAGVIGVGSVADQELVLPEHAPWLGLRELPGGARHDVLRWRPPDAA